MLAHSPPLPLVIDLFDYFNANRDITAEQGKGISLALEKRDRVRRIRLWIPQAVRSIQEFFTAINGEYPMLEYLIMTPSVEDQSTALVLPETFQAPHLRHLLLKGFTLPIGSQLLTTAMGIVTLILSIEHPSAYFQPNTLLQWISSMQQLETLQISFSFPVPNRDVERQPMPPPITTPVTLPNLRWFLFQGVSSYMEAVVRRIVTPRLEKLDIKFFKQLTFSVPFLLQFMKIENLRFDRADIEFANYGVYMRVYPEGALMHSLSINVRCWHLDWQVSSVAQISNSLSQIFSTMEHLTVELPTLGPILGYEVQSLSSEEHNEVDPNEWGKLLRSFNNVKALRINDRIAKELSRCLQPDDGESLLELLPKLEPGGLIYSGGTNDPDALKSFGNIFRALRARQPVTPVRHGPSPSFVNPVPRGSAQVFRTHHVKEQRGRE
jgi:hypothetical protein